MRLLLLAALAVAGCAQSARPGIETARPLDTQPAYADLASVRGDLIATAHARYGAAAVDRALAAPTHLIVKRFAGMVPPPPPGASPDWRPRTPSAMLIRDAGRWLAATPGGWRPVDATAGVRVDAVLAGPRLWSEDAATPACPDFGSSNLLLKVPARRETVRRASCSSAAADLVEVALAA